MTTVEMRERVREHLIADAREFGLSDAEADLYAAFAANSMHAAGIQLGIALDDMKSALREGADAARWRLLAILRRWLP